MLHLSKLELCKQKHFEPIQLKNSSHLKQSPYQVNQFEYKDGKEKQIECSDIVDKIQLIDRILTKNEELEKLNGIPMAVKRIALNKVIK